MSRIILNRELVQSFHGAPKEQVDEFVSNFEAMPDSQWGLFMGSVLKANGWAADLLRHCLSCKEPSEQDKETKVWLTK